MIRTTSSIAHHQVLHTACKAVAARAFTGAAPSDCAYYFRSGEVENGCQSLSDNRGAETAYSFSFGSENDLSTYASNGLLSPLLRRQLHLSAKQSLSKPPETLLRQDFEEEERMLIQQRTAADDDDECASSTTAEGASPIEISSHEDARPLPRTFAQATHPSESRPVVVAESTSPFRIVHVNSAWEGLCGYTRAEASGRALGELLGGPGTDRASATALIGALVRGEEEAGTVLTNYKGGDEARGFRNRLRMGPLRDDDGDGVKHFVGVLRDLSNTQ